MLKIKGFAAEDLNGFLDEGTEFSGELRFRDVMRVDGRVKGRIVSDNTLIIGETGQVDAEIDCGVVSIRGRVTGQVHGRQRIELLSGCRVLATLVSPKLLIEDGAFFQGDCRMGGPGRGAEAAARRPGGRPGLERFFVYQDPRVFDPEARPWYPAALSPRLPGLLRGAHKPAPWTRDTEPSPASCARPCPAPREARA